MDGKADRLIEWLEETHYLTAKAAAELGYSRSLLGKYAALGIIERGGHGVYSLPGEIPDEIFLTARTSSNLRVSHATALFLHGIAERTPDVCDFTLPSDKNPPRSVSGRARWFYVKPELFDLGAAELTTPFGNRVNGYDVERTLCDLVRGRGRCDGEVVAAAVRAYFGSGRRDLARLGEYAKRLGVFDRIMRYAEVMA